MKLRLIRPPATPPVVVGFLAAACWLIYAVTTGDPWLARSGLHAGLFMVCVVASAAFFVVVAAETVLALLAESSRNATGLQRVLLYGVLSFIGCFVTLSYFGVNLAAVLATSAVVTAVVGLALQPTLGSLISGLTLYADGNLRVDDTAIIGDDEMRVSAMNWRTVAGKRADGSTMVVTNAKISDSAFFVYRKGEPGRASLTFSAPLGASPQSIAELVADMLADMEEIDASRPIDVDALSLPAGASLGQYRADFWVHDHRDRAAAAARALARLWYVFQRHGLELAEPHGVDRPGLLAGLGGLDPAVRTRLSGQGDILLFAPGERLTLPDRLGDARLLLLSGGVRTAPQVMAGAAHRSIHTVERPRRAVIEELATELALLIGPYAEYAVAKAAERAADIASLRRMVADEIADPVVRADFLDRDQVQEPKAIGPGRLFEAQRDPSGALTCGPRLRAIDEVILLAAPAAAFAAPRRVRRASSSRAS